MATRRSGKRGPNKAEREFVSEAEEILESMRGELADLSERACAGQEADPDCVHGLFRAAHSLKALAGLFRFDPIEALAHTLEDVLDGMRMGRIASEPSLVAVIDESVELFAALLERAGDADAVAETAPSIEDLTARLCESARGPAQGAADGAGLDLDPALRQALTEYEEHRLLESLRRGRAIYSVEAEFALEAFEEGLSTLTAALKEAGELISTLPSAGASPDAGLRFALLAACDETATQLSERTGLPETQIHRVGGAAPGVADASESPESASAEPGGTETSLKSISETVRVDIRKLDELMNLVGELVIQRGAIGELVEQLVARKETARIGADFAKLHKGLDRKLRDLQSAVIEVRMVPLRQVFDKVSRVVRRMRSELGKEVELEVRGSDTELDKLIVEGLVDPLMHVVRNALDHGIETPEARRRAGKPACGTIQIEALQRGNHVVVEVRDDGGGIDRARLREKAGQLGLVPADATLGERETLDLIFAPGMSTRDEVTGTSGRGVGMDVVRANLVGLGGVVEIASEPGRGTRVAMTLPITLAIIQSLVVSAASQRFALPLTAVLETLWIEPDAIQVSEGREIMNLRGEPLLLRRLADEFELEGAAPGERPTVVVLGMGDQRMGLIVDHLDGQQDTVIKPIQGPLSQIRGIAGGTDLGDRQPLLVLDVSALLEDALRHREAA